MATNAVGNTLLNSLTNSTFDIGSMSEVLAEAEVAGPKSILENAREKTNTELNALTYLQSNVTAFKTYLTDLSDPSTYAQSSATSSNEALFTADITGKATNGSYLIESKQLAQSHTQVANKVYSSMSDAISTGTLDISVGGNSFDSIVIDASNNTLEGLQRTINNGDYGVNASIINTGSGYQLMFMSKNTGAASEMQISGISDFDTDGFTTTSIAQDAVMSVNGLQVSSANNQFDEVIPGLNINLKSAQVGSVQNLTVAQDSASVMEKVESFVEVYNQLDTILDELGSYEELTDDQIDSEEYTYWGDMAGSSMLRQIRRDLESSLSGAIDEISSNYNSLAVVGLSINQEGEMELDSSRLQSVAELGLENLQTLFAKGGSSDDTLINVVGGNERTQSGSFDLNISRVATRANVTGGNVTFDATGDEKAAGARVFDQEAVLTLDANASFDLATGASAVQTVDLSGIAGDYSSKDDLATAIQGQINSVFGSDIVTVAYDSTQARFEFTAADGQGAVDLTNVTNLSSQGLTQASYTGETLVNVTGGSLDLSIDNSDTTSVSLAAGDFTLAEIAENLRTTINNNSDIQATGAEVAVTTDGSSLSITSNRFGSNSSVNISGITGLAELNFAVDSSVGENVDGTITTDTGTINIGAYVDATDGRKVTISNFAVIGSEDAEVRGLSFEVLGGALGDRGTITFAQGFASRMEEAVSNLFESENGLVNQRLESLNSKNTQYDDKQEKLDARYEKLLLKYQLQFSTLQSILSSAQQTRDYLTATFSNNSDN